MSEDEVKEKIVEILERKYGEVNVHDPAGPNEHGADVVFIKTSDNEFGDDLVIGIQLKAEPTMNASGAQKAIGQATVALGHTFQVGTNNDGRTIDLMYIANYGKINATAREYLSDARRTLNNLKWIDITFLDPYLVDAVGTEDITGGDDDE